MKVYISGPMTGLPEFNYPAFFAAAEALEARGYETINPARTEGRASTAAHGWTSCEPHSSTSRRVTPSPPFQAGPTLAAPPSK